MNFGEVGDQLFFDNPKYHPTQNRAPDRADAANHRHQQNVHAGLKGEDPLGIDERCVASEHAAGNAGEGGGHGMDRKLVRKGVDANVGGSIFILLDGPERKTELATGNEE